MTRLIFILLFMSLSTHAWAEAEPDQSAINLAQRELMEGLQLIKSNKVKEGIRVLRRAYRAYPSPEILVLLGKVYDRFPQGCTRSLSTWRRLVNTCDEDCPFAQEALARLKTSEIECSGKLSIKTTPSKAEVFIGDQLRGVTPLDMEITDARSLKLTIFKNSYEILTHQVELKRKWGEHEVSLELTSTRERRGVDPESIARANPSRAHRGSTSASPNSTPLAASSNSASTSNTARPSHGQSSAQPSARPKTPKKEMISSPLADGEDPFLRLETPPLITEGKMARSAGRSMLTDLRCEYRTRFQRYVKLETCDATQLAMYDRFYLALNLQQDAYVYVVMSNKRGQWQLLFPSPMEDPLIKANQLTTIPNREWILLDEVEDTTDVISILASPRPIEALERQRSTPDLNQVPRSLMRYFVPMSNAYENKQVVSAQVMNRQTQHLVNAPLVLHTSYRIHR